MNSKTILIAGAGQLGSRYLQGLASCQLPLKIYVYDLNPDSLVRAQERWSEVVTLSTVHQVIFNCSLAEIPFEIDIAIVATTAEVRPKVVREIASHSKVRFWILEKVLAQSVAGLDEIVRHIGQANAWVNTPRRMLPWHHQLKSQLSYDQPMTLKVYGGSWGLACNSIHFLDMFAWLTEEELLEINTEQLDPKWVEAKRAGNWEVLGELKTQFSGGSSASLQATEGEVFYKFELTNGANTWLIDEEAGVAKRSDGFELPGRIPFQSEMSAVLVESILKNGTCELPALDESVKIHQVFIRGMLEHWRQSVDASATAVPIT